jgi:hypothetical protein
MPTHVIWKTLDPALANEIIVCALAGNKSLYRRALDVLSPHMGLRPVKVLEMPKIERHAIWQRFLADPGMEALGFNFLSHWLVTAQTPMLCAWLDALHIPHNAQGCADEFPACPSEAQLKKAVEALLKNFNPTLVAIYLRAFNEIDGVLWEPLQKLIDADDRLKLPA